jgi:hypothetical protein
LQLPWAQEASGSNPDAPTKIIRRIFLSLSNFLFTQSFGVEFHQTGGLNSQSLVSGSSSHNKSAKTWRGRSAIQKLLNGGKLSAHEVASLEKIHGTVCISGLINLRNCKSVIMRSLSREWIIGR